MTIATFMQRSVLFLALLQALCLTTCGKEQEPPAKTVIIQNITDAVELSSAGLNKIIADSNNNPFIKLRQGGGKSFIDTDGLYLLVLFIPSAPVTQLITDILKGDLEARDLIEFGAAIALAKVRSGTAERHILTLSAKATEVGYYWDGGGGDNHRICTMLVTPDARFVLRIDFSKSEFGNDPEYRINYSSQVDMETVFEVGAAVLPQELLGDDAVDYNLGRLM
jgi:hypothetical protein